MAILVFCLAAVLYAGLLPSRWRGWFLLVGSIIAVYWLQPPLPIRFSDYILPAATIGLTTLAWWFTRRQDDPEQDSFLAEDRWTFLLVVGLVLGLSFMRYVEAGTLKDLITQQGPMELEEAARILGQVGGGVTIHPMQAIAKIEFKTDEAKRLGGVRSRALPEQVPEKHPWWWD